jgi:predicted nucleotidyltransferase
VYLFGSRARRKHHSGSDIDFTLDAKMLGIGVIGNIKEEIRRDGVVWSN